jgi:general secretion pathway protein G
MKSKTKTAGDNRATRGQPQRKQPGRGQQGFTLIELLVVLAILGMLAAIAVPQVLKYLGRAKDDVVKVQEQALGTSLDLFLLDVGRYPTAQEGLQALVSPPAGLAPWHGPYVTKATSLMDPWGRPYVYRQPGQQGADYDLYSLGPDGNGQPPATGSPTASTRP